VGIRARQQRYIDQKGLYTMNVDISTLHDYSEQLSQTNDDDHEFFSCEVCDQLDRRAYQDFLAGRDVEIERGIAASQFDEWLSGHIY
jgi:hypothetical protein